jgi:hypothetical protein
VGEHRFAADGLAQRLSDHHPGLLTACDPAESGDEREAVEVDDGDHQIAVVLPAAGAERGGDAVVEPAAVEQTGKRLELAVQNVGVDHADRRPAGERDEAAHHRHRQ